MCIAAAIAVGVGTVGAAAISSNAASKAAKAQQAGYDAASAESARQYDQTRADYAPYLQAGKGALNLLTRAAGTNTGPNWDQYLADNPDVAASGMDPQQHYQMYGQAEGRALPTYSGTPDYSAFTASPGYQFRLDQGTKAGQNQFAARGGALSGNALKALADYNQNMASNEYGNWWNQIAGLAGAGQSATNSVASAGQQNSQNIQSNLLGSANARASGIQSQGDIWGGALNSLAGNYASYKLLGSGSKTPTYAMNYLGGRYGGYA